MVSTPHLIHFNAIHVNMTGNSGMDRTVLDVLIYSHSVNTALTETMSSNVTIAMEPMNLFIS